MNESCPQWLISSDAWNSHPGSWITNLNRKWRKKNKHYPTKRAGMEVWKSLTACCKLLWDEMNIEPNKWIQSYQHGDTASNLQMPVIKSQAKRTEYKQTLKRKAIILQRQRPRISYDQISPFPVIGVIDCPNIRDRVGVEGQLTLWLFSIPALSCSVTK